MRNIFHRGSLETGKAAVTVNCCTFKVFYGIEWSLTFSTMDKCQMERGEERVANGVSYREES